MKPCYQLQEPFSVAFSGGQTSGFMLRQIIDAHGGTLPRDSRVMFANTGLEHEKTLEFVDRVAREWGVNVVWLEWRSGNGFKVVDFNSAARNGEPMAALIEQRGYPPNPRARICTVELKMRTMIRYLKSIGWTSWEAAIGLRADEMKRATRLKGDIKAEIALAPMAEAGHTLKDVEQFWNAQSFNLEIDRWLGNCTGCFLKARRKIERLALESPEFLDFWIDTEERVGKPFRIDRPSYIQIRNQVRDQGRLFGDQDELDMPCRCHE